MFGQPQHVRAVPDFVIEPDVVEEPVGIGLAPTGFEGDTASRAAQAPEATPKTELKTLTLVPNTAVLIADTKPFRRTVTVVRVGAAMEFQLSFRSEFPGIERIFVASTTLSIDIAVFPGQRLWIQQATLINHDVSVIDTPEGPGRGV